MPIRLWPNDYVKKEHITSYERYLLRNAEKNFKDGHFVVEDVYKRQIQCL